LIVMSAPAKTVQAKAAAPPTAKESHPDSTASLSPARTAPAEPDPGDVVETTAEVATADTSEPQATIPTEGPTEGPMEEPTEELARLSDESEVEPSPGLLADPSDYTVASDETILVQPNETLGHYAEWLGLKTSRLRTINKLRYGQSVGIQQKLKLDFSSVRPDAFERIRLEYHRAMQEEFFAKWEIDGTAIHRVGPGDSLWTLSHKRFDVPIWLLRQYNPDVNLEALSRGTQLTIPKLRQRVRDTSDAGPMARTDSAG
jgi:membrane-bound lytic murein transglycosylase D